jgi:hypothetical protein
MKLRKRWFSPITPTQVSIALSGAANHPSGARPSKCIIIVSIVQGRFRGGGNPAGGFEDMSKSPLGECSVNNPSGPTIERFRIGSTGRPSFCEAMRVRDPGFFGGNPVSKSLSRLRPIPDGPGQWEVHRSGVATESGGPGAPLDSDNVPI